MKEDIEKLTKIREKAYKAGGEAKLAKIRSLGRLTARERISFLLDLGSFFEINTLAETQCTDFGMDRQKIPGDGVVIGSGTINKRPIWLYAHEATVFGGSGGGIHIKKMTTAIDMAAKMGVPFIGLNDSPGGRVQEGYGYLNYSGSVFYSNTQASGVVPQISAIMGPCAGFAVYGAAITDFVIMVDDTSQMFITGPSVVKAVTGEEITLEGLGGAKIHTRKTGVSDLRVKNDEECLTIIKKLLSYIPQNWMEKPPQIINIDPPDRVVDELEKVVPSDSKKPYDMCEVIKCIADDRDFFEIKPEFAKNIVIGFIRLDGYPVGIIGNQPLVFAGSLTVDSSDKEARFIRFCDAFNIPLVFLMDVPGYFPGVAQEHSGIIRHGAKVLYAICEASVPMISVILRKGYGGGLVAMGGHKAQGTDLVFAWPIGELSVMGADGAVEFLYRKELKEADNPAEFKEKLKAEYREKFANPYYAAAKTIIDDVIEPRETRSCLVKAVRILLDKKVLKPKRKHGNMPM
jgi:acetyl-CoA carboxylase carboxyltransferase component